MILPPSKGYYVTERIDTPYLSPPPPPPVPNYIPTHYNVIQSNKTNNLNPDQKISKLGLAPNPNLKPSKGITQNEKLSLNSEEVISGNQGRIPQYPGQKYPGYGIMNSGQSYKEWETYTPPGVSKIVNRPPKPYQDKYKPSYVSIFCISFCLT